VAQLRPAGGIELLAAPVLGCAVGEVAGEAALVADPVGAQPGQAAEGGVVVAVAAATGVVDRLPAMIAELRGMGDAAGGDDVLSLARVLSG